MSNAAVSFMGGLVMLALALDFETREFSNLIVVPFFFLALFLLVPVTLLQMHDDAYLARAFKRKKDQ